MNIIHGGLFPTLLLCLSLTGCKSTPTDTRIPNDQGPENSALLDQADALFRAKRYHTAIATYHKAAEQAIRDGAPSVQVEAYAQLARCSSLDLRTGLRASEVTDDSRRWFMKARDLASPARPKGWSRLLFVRGLLELQARMNKEARGTFEELFIFCEERGLTLRAIDAAHHLSFVTTGDEQLTWITRAIEIAEKEKSDYWLAQLWRTAGECYEIDRKDLKAAIDAYATSRRHFKILGDVHDSLMADWAYGRALRLGGKLDEASIVLEEARTAAHTRFEEEEAGSFIELAFLLYEVGEIALAKGAKDQAHKALSEARYFIETCMLVDHWRRNEIAEAIGKRLANAQ